MKSIVQAPLTKIGEYRDVGGPFVLIENGTPWRINKTMALGDRGHYGYPNFPPARGVGGPFTLYGYETNRTRIAIGEIYKSFGVDQTYTGSVLVNVPDAPIPANSYAPDGRAAEAYKKMKPTRPEFAGLNALVELRDMPFMLRQRIDGIKSIGNYWLALKFGWEPLLKDIRSCFMFQQNAEKRLKQLLRDNGRPVRRRITLLDDIETTLITTGTTNPFQPFWPAGWSSNQKWTLVQTFGNQWWASARFRYWLPGGPRDIAWTRRMKAKLFGLNPSPSVIYNAIPWSWLIDWFSTAGDVIENLEAGVADRLAADYFYVMRTRWAKNEMFSQATYTRRSGEKLNISGSGSSLAFRKARVKGDPFGFNTNENSLTGMQLSILGALGMSRLL